jgi:hypothetical protein
MKNKSKITDYFHTLSAVLFSLFLMNCASVTADSQQWDKTFFKSDKVIHEKVTYGPHFLEIGAVFHGFDLALLDCGQYDSRWAYIHMTPEEADQAALDLSARGLIPAHVGRFTIANHPWDEPFERLTEASLDKLYQLLTPRIGEPMLLEGNPPRFSSWWVKDGKSWHSGLSGND